MLLLLKILIYIHRHSGCIVHSVSGDYILKMNPFTGKAGMRTCPQWIGFGEIRSQQLFKTVKQSCHYFQKQCVEISDILGQMHRSSEEMC